MAVVSETPLIDALVAAQERMNLDRRDGEAIRLVVESGRVDPDHGIRVYLPDAEDDDYLVTISDDVGGYGKTIAAACSAALEARS